MGDTPIIVFGHSYVKRLKYYVKDNNLGLFKEVGNVKFWGFSGAHVPRLIEKADQFEHVLKDCHVILQIGGNDLNSDRVNPETLAEEILNLARRLINQKGVHSVCIGQLLYRSQSRGSRFILRRRYNIMVDILNKKLQFLCEFFPRITFWSHRRMLQNCKSYMDQDGTHLNKRGMKKYARSVRGAMLKAISTAN